VAVVDDPEPALTTADLHETPTKKRE